MPNTTLTVNYATSNIVEAPRKLIAYIFYTVFNFLLAPKPDQASILDNPESTYYLIDANDALETLPEITDIRFYVSFIMRALQSNKIDPKELQQFLNDITRTQRVLVDGLPEKNIDGNQFLYEIATRVAADSGINPNQLLKALVILNQGVGNSALAFASQFNPQSSLYGSPIISYRSLLRSPKHSSILSIDGSRISMRYTVALQAVSEDGLDYLDPDQQEEDVLLQSTVTLDFGAKTAAQIVRHEIELQKTNSSLMWAFPTMEEFQPKGFDVISASLDQDAWELVPYKPELVY